MNTSSGASFEGKVVYISGGTSGINLGIAKGFAARGARVLVFGRKKDQAEAAAREIQATSGQRAMPGSADVRDPEAVSKLFAQACVQIGSPDVVIAGAAGNFMASAVNISANGFKTVVDIDLLGTYNVFRSAFDVVNSPGASLIAITAPQAVRPMPGQVHVCAAKAGVNMIVKVLAMEWGQAGIRVNAICPGPIAGTEGVERMAPTDADKAQWLKRTALRRFGTPSDIANAALFLSSDAASFVTGTVFDCDGGMTLGDAVGSYLVKERR
jgi:NAD(P)-dependent dehydrogenase (short-subunit alcohol dehydrogenase family)